MIEHPNIHEALTTALARLSDLERTRTAKVDTRSGGSYSYTYTDLADVLGYVRPILAEHGLALTNPVGMTDGILSVRTRIRYRDGSEDLSPEILYPVAAGTTPQQFGGLITYLRRYSTLASCGLATEDNDGNAGPQVQTKARRPETPTPPRSVVKNPTSTSENPPTKAQFIRLQVLMREHGLNERTQRLEYVSRILGREISTTNEVSKDDAEILIDALEEDSSRNPWHVDHSQDEDLEDLAKAQGYE